MPSQRYYEEPPQHHYQQRYNYTSPAIIQLPVAEAEIEVEDTDDDMQLIEANEEALRQQEMEYVKNYEKIRLRSSVDYLASLESESIVRKRSSEAVADDDDGAIPCSNDNSNGPPASTISDVTSSTGTETGYTRRDSTRSQSPPKRQKLGIEVDSCSSEVEPIDETRPEVRDSKTMLAVMDRVGLGRVHVQKRRSEELETLSANTNTITPRSAAGGGGGGGDDRTEATFTAAVANLGDHDEIGTPKRARIALELPSLPSSALGGMQSKLNPNLKVGVELGEGNTAGATAVGTVVGGGKCAVEEGMDG